MAERTVTVAVVLDLLRALRALGASPEELNRAVGLPATLLRDAAARVPSSAVERLLAFGEHRLGDPVIGLHAGETVTPRGAIAYLLLSCPRMDWAIRRWLRFGHVAADPLGFELHRRGDVARLVVRYDARSTMPDTQAIDYVMVLLVKTVRAAMGHLEKSSVELRRHAPERADEFRRVLGCAVRFGCAKDALVFPARMLAMPSRFANPLVAERIDELARVLETRVHRPTFHARVADVVRALLIAGTRPNRPRVARQLGVSGRTLQRALANEGMTFREVRDNVVWDGVPTLLSNPACNVQIAAVSAGFADTASFSKAFKRRMGCSPSRYRDGLAFETLG